MQVESRRKRKEEKRNHRRSERNGRRKKNGRGERKTLTERQSKQKESERKSG